MFGRVEDGEIVYNAYGIDYFGFIQTFYEGFLGGNFSALVHTIERWWTIYSIIAILVSLLLFVGYVYAKIRYAQLSDMEQEALRNAENAWATKHANPDSRNARWDIIQKRVTENSPESWRIAIIEADILLDETLSNAGYPGQSLGEKLKGANPQSFTTIQDAWEAHKVRNEIAHAGSDFVLTQKSARDTLSRFERVFREFGVI
jgi:hypothetical protein